MSNHLLHGVPEILAASRHGVSFHLSFAIQPILALLAGVLILIRPRFLNFIVAIYLIIVGLIGVLGLSF